MALERVVGGTKAPVDTGVVERTGVGIEAVVGMEAGLEAGAEVVGSHSDRKVEGLARYR